MGSLVQNDVYCSKAATLVEFGDKPSQGARSDLVALKEEIKNGLSVDDIVLDRPHLYHQYGRALTRIETIVLRSKFRSWMTKGYWYWGPTGTGKSHASFQDYDPKTTYVKCLEDEWWCGYVGQETVLLNDFRGEIKYGQMLNLCDKWPHMVKVRNKEPVPFLAKKIIVTSSLHPVKLYAKLNFDDSIEQLLRRFECVALNEVYLAPVENLAQKCSEGNTISSEPL